MINILRTSQDALITIDNTGVPEYILLSNSFNGAYIHVETHAHL